MTTLPTDPVALASRLGALSLGERWWSIKDIAAHYGYHPQLIHDWINDDGWGAGLPRRRGPRRMWLFRCVTPPPPPVVHRGAAGRRGVIAAVAAAGGRPGRGRPSRGFWARIGAACGMSADAAYHRYRTAERLGEI